MRRLCLAVWMAAVGSGFGQGKALPTPQEEAKAEALITEIYQDEIAKAAKDPALLARLAQVFLQEGRDTGDYPAGRYRLFQAARDLASMAGDAPTALQAVEELGAEFALAPAQVLAMKIHALKTAAMVTDRTPDTYRQVLQTAEALVEDLNDRHDYGSALEVLKAAEFAGKRLKSLALVGSIRKRIADTTENQKAFAPLQVHMEKLKRSPDDTESNLLLGNFFAMQKGDWARGLPYLARSGQPVAIQDLKFPTTHEEQAKLALDWLAIAQAGQAKAIERARFWYDLASVEATPAQKKNLAERFANVPQFSQPRPTLAHEVRSLEGHQGPVHAVAVSPDGRKIVTAGADHSLIVWDVKTGKELRRLDGHSNRIWSIAFSPDSRRVISGGFDNSIRVWDLVSARDVRKLAGHGDYVRSVVFSSDGKLALSGGDDRIVRFWDVEKGEEIRSLKGHQHFVWSVALSRDNAKALSGSLDRTVRLWDLRTGLEEKKLEGHADTVLTVAFSPSGKRAVTGSTDKTIKLWDLETGKEVHTFTGHTGYVHSVAFSPDGRQIISASQDKTVRLWDLVERKQIAQLEGHTDQVWQALFGPDGQWAVSVGHDRSVRVWGAGK